MFESLAGALHMGLSLWNSKEKRKYLDELTALEREHYEEDKKPRDALDPRDARNDALLDDIRFRLCQLQRNLAAEVGASIAPNQPGSSGT